MNLLSAVPVCRAQVRKKYKRLQTSVTQIMPVWRSLKVLFKKGRGSNTQPRLIEINLEFSPF
jgi:hypothetical protein